MSADGQPALSSFAFDQRTEEPNVALDTYRPVLLEIGGAAHLRDRLGTPVDRAEAHADKVCPGSRGGGHQLYLLLPDGTIKCV